LINIYKVNPDFIYKGEGKIIRSFDGNIVSEERASYGNKEYEIQSLEKDITMLKEEIRHLNKASLLKDEIIAQLKENKQMLEQKLKKSGIKSGIGNN
jgi:predicted RNase H-like nuclease (RuvC/YqgF family)